MPHQQNFELSGIPLLPYERQLAGFLELTEAEYRQYRDELINSGKPRPAEYALIPDIRNEPATTTAILINLAIGLALTAVSVLLAPKPKAPGTEEDERQSIQLADQTGRSRFNSVAGFDGVQQIAELGSVIPIHFGRYQQHTRDGETYYTGGFMASPGLVWSRMFSYGTHQGFKGLYTVGECLNDPSLDIAGKDDPTRPDDAGIQLGTLPIDALPDQQQAVYWNSNFGFSRITADDLVYGTRAYPAAGDPENNNDIFTCPTATGEFQPAFCMAYAPSGDTTFGFHSPISNGMGFMLNFRIIPLPRIPGQPDDPGQRIQMERRKVAGDLGDNQSEGMGTVGRGYGSQMGLLSLNGWEPSNTESRVDVNPGDEAVFWIRKEAFQQENCLLKEGDESVKASDVNNAVNNRRASADDALQIGETIMIGRTIWQVINRNDDVEQGGKAVWLPETVNDDGNAGEGDGQSVFITLKMIENTTDGQGVIGLPGKTSIESFILWEGEANPPGKWNGTSFWSLGKADLAVIRNVRPAEVTEFGIKSQVWGQANGLCNFADLPKPEELKNYEEDGNQLTVGRMNLYYKRTSVFTIYIRPVSDTNESLDWKPIGEQFCVSNNQPVDVYNTIRVTDLSGPRQMEYRFIPKNSADVLKNSAPGAEYSRLDVKKGSYQERTYDTAYGQVKIGFTGDFVRWDDQSPTTTIQYNPEFRASGVQGSADGTPDRRPTEMRFVEGVGGQFAEDAFASYVLNEGAANLYKNNTQTGELDVTYGAKTARLKFTYQSNSDVSTSGDYYNTYDMEWRWRLQKIEVISASTDWVSTDQFEVLTTDDNFYSNAVSYLGSGNAYGVKLQVSASEPTNPGTVEGDESRRFGGKTQLNEYAQYAEQNLSCSSGPEHVVTWVNEIVTPPSVPTYAFTSIGLALRSSNQINTIEQLRVWIGDGVWVKRWEDNTYGPSNLFSNLVYYLLTDNIAGLGSWNKGDTWTDTSSFTDTAKYLEANNIMFDGTIESKVNVRSYLTETAPLNLCNFVIANGQFSIVPALPYDPNTYEISPDALPIKAIFSAGNIVDGSYSVDYLDAAERQDIKAVMTYRQGQKNKVPKTDSIMVRWNEDASTQLPQTVFDISNFCSDKEQAKMIGRYLLSVRRRIDHAITFQTSPLGLSLAPGDYIKVITTDTPDTPFTIGAISPETGQVLSALELADGSHEVTAYVPGSDAVRLITIEILNNCVTDPALFGTLFTTLVPREAQNTYLVEQLDLGEDGLVNVTASHFPTGDITGKSIIALDTIDAPYNDGFTRRFTYFE